jgi:MoaA/NifB/PqqE/SkfB family radical SAM enzyme
LENEISLFELPLLSSDRAVHDRMSGAKGAFDAVTMAMAELKAAGQRVVAVFVATKLNIHTWRETAELAVALGLDGIMFNRFNPGGRGLANLQMLQAGPVEISAALDTAEAVSEQYGIPITCSIPMPPCIFDRGRYRKLTFGFCPAGTERAYYALDPLGNVRPCNHSPTILGNIRDRGFWELAEGHLPLRPRQIDGRRRELLRHMPGRWNDSSSSSRLPPPTAPRCTIRVHVRHRSPARAGKHESRDP